MADRPERPDEDASAAEIQAYIEAYDSWLDGRAAELIREQTDD